MIFVFFFQQDHCLSFLHIVGDILVDGVMIFEFDICLPLVLFMGELLPADLRQLGL